MRRNVSTLALSIVALALVAACGGDDEPEADAESPAAATTEAPPVTDAPAATDPPATTEAPATTEPPATSPPTTEDTGPRPVYPGKLEPDTYRNKRFETPIVFTIEQEWESMESRDALLFFRDPVDDSELAPGDIGLLFSMADSSIDEVVELLRTTPGVTFGEPEPATITGLDGVVVTSDAVAEEVNYGWLTDRDFGGNWYTIEGRQSEVYAVDQDGRTLIVWLDAPSEDWDAFRAEAMAVLDSVVWGE